MPNLPQRVLDNGPWSISKIGVIEKCSKAFDYKYGPNKIKEVDTREESRVGVAVHKALELVLADNDQKMSFLMATDEGELTTDEIDQVQAFWDQVTRFKKRMDNWKRGNGVLPQNVFLERKWGLSVDFKKTEFFGNGVFFRGVVDYGLRTAKNDMVIIDHKSGGQKPLKYYENQFKGYALLALARYPDIEGVQTAINFIADDVLEWGGYVTAEVIRNEYQPWLLDHLIKSTVGLDSPPKPLKNWSCNWCGYRSLCPLFGGATRGAEEAR